VRVYGNGYAGYREGRRAERERWEHEFERQQTELARLQDSLSSAQNRLVSGWRPEKGTNKHGRATRAGGLVQSVHRRQEQLEAHAVTVPSRRKCFASRSLRPEPERCC
jgi:macrolide transport system ATP-binding/permease protein